MPPRTLNTPSAPKPVGPYSHAVAASGEVIFCAGQIPLDPATGTLVEGDITAQATQVLDNIEALGRDLGMQWRDIAKATIFLVDLADFATVNALYAERVGNHRPARSTIQVAALPAGARVEIEVVFCR